MQTKTAVDKTDCWAEGEARVILHVWRDTNVIKALDARKYCSAVGVCNVGMTH